MSRNNKIKLIWQGILFRKTADIPETANQTTDIELPEKTKPPKDPNIIFGRGIRGEPVKNEPGGHKFRYGNHKGQILKTDQRVLKTGSTLLTFDITDFSYSLTCKLFPNEEELEIVKEKLVKGQYIRLSGEAQYDMFAKELVILARDILLIDVENKSRSDNAPEKRVELHLHTQMSQLDAVSAVKDIINRRQAGTQSCGNYRSWCCPGIP